MDEKVAKLISAVQKEVPNIDKLRVQAPQTEITVDFANIPKFDKENNKLGDSDTEKWVISTYNRFISNKIPNISNDIGSPNLILLGSCVLVNFGAVQRLCIIIKELWSSIYVCIDISNANNFILCSKDQIHPFLQYISAQNSENLTKNTEVFVVLPSKDPKSTKIYKGTVNESKSPIESDFYTIQLENSELIRVHRKFITKIYSPFECSQETKIEFLNNTYTDQLLRPFGLTKHMAEDYLTNQISLTKKQREPLHPFYVSVLDALSNMEQTLVRAPTVMPVRGELPLYLRRPPPEIAKSPTSISLRRPDAFDDERTVIHLKRLVYDEDSFSTK